MSPVETEVYALEVPTGCGGEAPDEVLLERICAGETSLFEVLVHRHNPRLRCLARRVLCNEADVDDVIQEAHLNAFCSISRFEGRSSYKTWISRIAFHAAVSRLRHRTVLRELSPGSSNYNPFETMASAQRNPEQQLQDKEAIQTLNAAAQALPEPYRAVFHMRRVKELSISEVAVSLDISEQCAKTRLHRAMGLLDSRLREQWNHLR